MRGTQRSQRRIQRLPTLLLQPILMLPCSLYQPAALAAATLAGVGYDVEADSRRCFYSRAGGVRQCFGSQCFWEAVFHALREDAFRGFC